MPPDAGQHLVSTLGSDGASVQLAVPAAQPWGVQRTGLPELVLLQGSHGTSNVQRGTFRTGHRVCNDPVVPHAPKSSSRDTDFTDKLVDTATLSELLQSLVVASAVEYIFIAERSMIDWRVSQVRERTLVLRDLPSAGLSAQPELAGAKQVYVILRFADGGLARYDLTSRICETWIRSDQLDHAVNDFRRALDRAGRAPLITPSAATALFGVPFIAFSICLIVFLLVQSPRDIDLERQLT